MGLGVRPGGRAGRLTLGWTCGYGALCLWSLSAIGRMLWPMQKKSIVFVLPLAVIAAGCASHPPATASVSPQPASTTVSASAPSSTAMHTPPPAAKPQPTEVDGRTAAGFADWVSGFRQRAQRKGVSSSTLKNAFGNAEFIPRIIELDNRQPEFNRAIWDYLDTAVSDSRVRHGSEKLAQYDDLSRRVENDYGVPRTVITAIWGMESNYGSNFGSFETIDALATLGYDGRRESFAESQLYAAMKILDEGDISRTDMRGSWAGAMGHTQFLPTSFLAYAVDGDNDGKRDIWGSIPDVMASTANYLARNGWDRGDTWGREVTLPASFDYTLADGDTRRSSSAWQSAGVKAIDSRGMPNFSSAGVIAPAGAKGPAFIVGPNFRTILRYNNATSYALAVGLLSDRLAGEPGVQAAWPRDLASLSNSQVRQLQGGLNALGYGSGTPDGIVGPNTRSGIRAFQRDHGLIADGYPTSELLDKVQAAQ